MARLHGTGPDPRTPAGQGGKPEAPVGALTGFPWTERRWYISIDKKESSHATTARFPCPISVVLKIQGTGEPSSTVGCRKLRYEGQDHPASDRVRRGR